MRPDGTIRAATLLNPEYRNEQGFTELAESARRALSDPHCQPLPLPLAKYAGWSTIKISFDPAGKPR